MKRTRPEVSAQPDLVVACIRQPCAFHNRLLCAKAAFDQKYLAKLGFLCPRRQGQRCEAGDLWDQAILSDKDAKEMSDLGRGNAAMQHMRDLVSRRVGAAALELSEKDLAATRVQLQVREDDKSREAQHFLNDRLALECSVGDMATTVAELAQKMSSAISNGDSEAEIQKLHEAGLAQISSLPASDIVLASELYGSLCNSFEKLREAEREFRTRATQANTTEVRQAPAASSSPSADAWTPVVCSAVMHIVTTVVNAWREQGENYSFKEMKQWVDDRIFTNCTIEWGGNTALKAVLGRLGTNSCRYGTNSFWELVRFIGNANRHYGPYIPLARDGSKVSPIRYCLDADDHVIYIVLWLLYHDDAQKVVPERDAMILTLEGSTPLRNPGIDLFRLSGSWKL